jgi:hypothetical protein
MIQGDIQQQKEMPWLMQLEQANWVDQSVVHSWKSYREAVMWCWRNRPANRGRNEVYDQAMCARVLGCHAPHFSRFVNPNTKSPMDLKPDLVPAFEAYTGWRGITQYQAKVGAITLLEEIQAARRVA